MCRATSGGVQRGFRQGNAERSFSFPHCRRRQRESEASTNDSLRYPATRQAFSPRISAANEFLQRFRIASTLHWDFRGSRFQFAKLFRRKLHVDGSEVFFKPLELGRARNRHNPGFLRQNPRQCDLSRCNVLLLGKSTDHVNHSLICVAILWGEARYDIAEVVFVELRVFVNCSRKETLSERAERHETDAEFFE